MRREQYNSGLHTLDSLAAIVSIAPDRTSNISKVLWTFFTSLNGSRMTLTFFRKSSKLFFKVPFQKSQNIKFSWHKKPNLVQHTIWFANKNKAKHEMEGL